MKKILLTAIALIMTAYFFSVFIISENQKVDAACKVVKHTAYIRMVQAESEGNLPKVYYYRHQYDNPEIIVSQLGAEFILANNKKVAK